MKWYLIAGLGIVVIVTLFLGAILIGSDGSSVDTTKIMYAWKDKDGKFYVTNTKPPDGATLVKVIKHSEQSDEPTPVDDTSTTPYSTPIPQKTAVDTRKRSNSGNVELYSTSWCVYCRKARQFFKDNNIDFVEYDIEKSSEGRTKYQKHQGRGVPLIVIGDQVIRGFNERVVKQALNLN